MAVFDLVSPACRHVHQRFRLRSVPSILLLFPLFAALSSVLHGCAEDPAKREMMERLEAERDERLEAKFQKQTEWMEGALNSESGELSGMPDGVKRFQQKRTKQIGVKTARAFMKEILFSVTTEEAAKKISAARAQVEPREKRARSRDEDGEEEAEADLGADDMLRAVGPVVDQLIRGVVLKYDFEGGFREAMDAVNEAMRRKGDPELKAALQQFADLFAPVRAGRVLELGKIAGKFLEMDSNERDAAIKRAEQMFTETVDVQRKANIAVYLEAMRGVAKHGSAHVKETVAKLVADAKRKETKDREALSPAEKDEFNMRVETYLEFLGNEETEQLTEHLSANALSHAEL
eukprot:TRINITY_DN25716_c0_g1_i1.p1 TRINITY_DN25716_c0_g1~~TRINITY_DN25716_c0_g1_i1.p1  ORF type:complete len:349 (-),score=82.88 TRINITY_DN25716_c0_g1_i1:132-1178(-)